MKQKLKYPNIKLKFADYIVTGIFISLTAFFLISWTLNGRNNERHLLVSTPSGNYEYPLNQNRILHIRGFDHTSIIEIKDGKAGFIESHCPNKICLRFGFISLPGASSICVPNRVSITILSKKNNASADTICR